MSRNTAWMINEISDCFWGMLHLFSVNNYFPLLCTHTFADRFFIYTNVQEFWPSCTSFFCSSMLYKVSIFLSISCFRLFSAWFPWNPFSYILFNGKRLQMMLWHHNARVNSHQRWKHMRFRVCFHLWCELTSTMNVTEWQVSWNSWYIFGEATRFKEP